MTTGSPAPDPPAADAARRYARELTAAYEAALPVVAEAATALARVRGVVDSRDPLGATIISVCDGMDIVALSATERMEAIGEAYGSDEYVQILARHRVGTLGPIAEAALVRALRDITDGHLTVWRGDDGVDRPDRPVVGAPTTWWDILARRGLYHPPATTGRWSLGPAEEPS